MIHKELAAIREKASALRARWKEERAAITRVRELKAKIDQLRHDFEIARARGEFEKASRIEYLELRQAQAELDKLNAQMDGKAGGARLLKEEVDEEDVARIVSKWTGIPVSKML